MLDNFRYLATVVNGLNESSGEIEQQLQAGLRAYLVYKDLLKDKKIWHKTKVRLKHKVQLDQWWQMQLKQSAL